MPDTITEARLPLQRETHWLIVRHEWVAGVGRVTTVGEYRVYPSETGEHRHLVSNVITLSAGADDALLAALIGAGFGHPKAGQ